ncbi:MAG: DNA-directed RNA polymerase subunit beta' [Victivallales bacterium]|nr:DNA-directed RNA polymerase subunit beta' [Victivallales bacterium]
MDSTKQQELDGFGLMEGSRCVSIGVASPDTIRSWSRGEVKNPETINYRTFKPEKGGLFCERIFGPQHDYECACGKYKRQKNKGIVCDRCGVEVTVSRVRRERMGHLDLAVPVSHVWFFKCLPSRLSMMIDITPKKLEQVLYYERWIVIDPGNTPLQEKTLLSDEEYQESRRAYGDSFEAGMGAEAVEKLLGRLNLAELKEQLEQDLISTSSKAARKKIVKRVRLVEGFLDNNMDPRWMILHVLPVIPPDLRPLVPLEGGRFATSDLNDLYRRVINRNTRLKNLLEHQTPQVIINNEKRMLQEAVDALLDNGRRGRAVTGSGNRPLKSLTDMLKGKQGRFRQNLLGKRVDYSGRSVIVVGPELKINQCGLPKEMAKVLFEPFITRCLKSRGFVHTLRNAKKWIEQGRPEVWDILDEVIKGHPVLLNRAPTLHRLSIQAFDPILIEGQAIRLHPLVCTAFNADFDGDQMAVHVPLSNEAQLEAKLIMLSPNNIFSPASGKALTTPSQDMTLGAYYLTYEDRRKKEAFLATPPMKQKWFNDFHELLRAYDAGYVGMHEFVNLRNPFYGKNTVWSPETKNDKFIVTTVGRCFFKEIWPEEMGFWNQKTGKKELGRLIKDCYETVGRANLIPVLDALKHIGYEYATKAGFSIGIKDMIVPKEKQEILAKAQAEIDNIRLQFRSGSITEQERYNKSVNTWTAANNELAKYLVSVLEENGGKDEINPVFAMLDSGARGSKDQIRQLSGMRGLMAKASGEIIERPIKANFREGLSVLEYFISSHGARKGLADTALKTADSGYMTRRLVDVAHDVICVEDDCHTINGVEVKAIREGNEDTVPLEDRITGRFSVDDINDPDSGKLIVAAGEEITAPIAKQIKALGIDKVRIRSVLTCESERGICCKCYGRNLATGEMPAHGEPVGIIAAQSIGEPGTQLTMRTFHFGGTATASQSQQSYKATKTGILRITIPTIKLKEGGNIIATPNGHAVIESEDGVELENYELVVGSVLEKTDGEHIYEGEEFVKWDAYSQPILAKVSGKVEFSDLIEGQTMKTEQNSENGREEIMVLEHSDDIHPAIIIKVRGSKDDQQSSDANYPLPAGAHIMVTQGQTVTAGETLAKQPRQSVRTGDITGGLPRVAELFEARRPKEAAEIAKIAGIVKSAKTVKNRQHIIIQDPESEKETDHLIPTGKRVIVNEGDFVYKGEPLTDGMVVLQEMLDVCGPQELQTHLVNQVQQVYRSQGVEINDKHIEIIVRQMMRFVRITDPGQTRFLFGEAVEKRVFREENKRILAEGGVQAEAQQMLLGISKTSLATDSFISAASFQDTTRVLTEAATLGRVDQLRGFKENVIMGHLIPAGTGYHTVQDPKLTKTVNVEELDKEDEEQRKAAQEAHDNAARETFNNLFENG